MPWRASSKSSWNKWQGSPLHQQTWAQTSHPLKALEIILDPNLQNFVFQNSLQCISSYLSQFISFVGHMRSSHHYSCKLLISEMLMLQPVVTVSIKASCIIFLLGSCPIFWPCPFLEVETGCDWQFIVACVCRIICVYYRNIRENAMLIIDFKRRKTMLPFTSKRVCSYSKFYCKNLKACVYLSAES